MRIQDTPMLLEQASSQVRRELICQRKTAMRGNLDQADAVLRALLAQKANSGSDIDVVALAMSRAELLHLDGNTETAIEQFENTIRHRLDRLDLPIRFAVEQNFIDLRLNPFRLDTASAVTDFYHLSDRKRVAAIKWNDNSKLISAFEAIEKEDHREALSALWYESIRTYRLGCWSVHRDAMRRLGQHWLRIGEPEKAAYCAILALDDELVRAVANDLLERMDAILIERVIKITIRVANLQKHFCTACEFLTIVGDVIADQQLNAVAEWLLSRCSNPKDEPRQGTESPGFRSWNALMPIAHRLPPPLTRRAVATAVTHPSWTKKNASWVVREQIIKTVNHLVQSLPTEDMEALAHQVLPLSTDRMSDTDYDSVINLLCHIATRGGDRVRDLIGDHLFAPSRPRYHILGQIAHLFHREFLPIEQLHQLHTRVIHNVRQQVQRKPHDQSFEQVPGSIVQITRKTESQTICISITGMTDWNAVARCRKQLAPDSIQEMACAAIEMVVDPDNDLSNRLSLIHAITALSDSLNKPAETLAFEVFERIARGEIEVSSEEPPSGPLDMYKFRSNSRQDLQGAALLGAARIGSRHPDQYRERLEELLDEAFSSPHVEVRRGAFAAFRAFPVRAEGALLTVLLGTRDPDPGGAITAFASLAEKRDLTLNRNHWRLLLYSIRLANRSSNTKLRRHAAHALARLIGLAPRGTIRNHAQDILANFRADMAASVRMAAQQPTK